VQNPGKILLPSTLTNAAEIESSCSIAFLKLPAANSLLQLAAAAFMSQLSSIALAVRL